MKFDLTNFLELDTKALMAINGGGTCGGGSCSSGGSSYRGGGSCSSSSSYGGSCGGGSSYGGSCGGKNVVVKPYNPTPSEPDANLTLPPTEPISGSWGQISNEIAKKSTMQDHKDDGLDKMNGKDSEGNDNQFSLVGCKMEGASKILTEITGQDIDITTVNGSYDTNRDGLMTQSEITAAIEKNLSEEQTLVSDYWEKQLTKEKLDEIANNQNGTTYVLGRAEDVHGGQHWIVLEGYSVNASGQVEFDYNGTSQNDAYKNRKYILGELTAEQKANNYHQISKIETYTII